MADELEQPLKTWTESQVSAWLRTIGVKEQYINKLNEEEVDGHILLSLNEDFLRTKICMKSGPAHMVIQKRDELVNSQSKSQGKKKPTSGNKKELQQKNTEQKSPPPNSQDPPTQSHETDQEVRPTAHEPCGLTSKDECKPRPFDQDDIDFLYIKHRVLQPESGAYNLISPLHEFKSLAVAVTLDDTKLKAKFAKEVLKFATGCMNIRSNGTIHFGVMDSKEDPGYVHGEIIGVPVKDKDIYVDALNNLEKSFSADGEHVRQCVRPPRFVEVMDRNTPEKRFVIEVDVVPLISIVKGKVYAVRLPNFKETTNKIELEKETIFRRVGSKTEPVLDKDLNDFYHRVKDRDAQREEAEKSQIHRAPEISPDLGRKLTMLMTGGKKCIEKDKWFILVTNKFKPTDLCNIEWLLNMNVFCVFEFDPDSNVSGLCSRYLQHHAANKHFLQSYRISRNTSIKEFVSQLKLFEQTSWIFCNGRSDYDGSEDTCDEMTWVRHKMTFLREAVSSICKQILPKGAYQVIFLLTSPVEKPLLHTFSEFFTDMEGHEDIICICESKTHFQKWQSFAEGLCGKEIVNNSSVVGMKMSHINATLLQVQPVKSSSRKYLPVFVKGTCLLETKDEEEMYSLEILTVDHCDETSEVFINEEKANIESQFDHGGRLSWLNLWLAEHKYIGDVIERDAYHDVSKVLTDTLTYDTDQMPVNCITIYHHPGSGGSTVGRQVLWNKRKSLRCAVRKPSYPVDIIAEHAVRLREYEEKDPHKCLPVLLLIEDTDKEYLDDLRHALEVALNIKKIQYETLCFILLSCRRSNDPETRCKEFPLQNVAVTHKLSPQEKRKFTGKLQVLKEQYQPEFILNLVLMSRGFDEKYVRQFVKHLLEGIDHQSTVTRLIHYVALLNTYVQKSFISQSHCEALLALTVHMERFRQHEFERSLSDQAKLLFLHLRDDKTQIRSIRIIHPLVAKEILQQLLREQETQSSLAMNLLCETVLFDHTFGREEYLSFLRALFISRSRISKGDECDTLFSPLIEHVCKNEKNPKKALDLFKEAFERFDRDPFCAQQLARLLYHHKKFEEAKPWADTAAKQQPNNSYILDTKGQVYRKCFQAKCKSVIDGDIPKTAENTADAVGTALKALECFHECEKAAEADMENPNSSWFFSDVEVGSRLLTLISSLEVFSNKTNGHAEFMKYLVTDYIPGGVKEPWEPFHGPLKELYKTMQGALEWISGDFSYYQTDIDEDEGTSAGTEEKINHSWKWLAKKFSASGKYFTASSPLLQQGQSIPASLTPFQKRMIIYRLDGGNVISTLDKLTEQKDAECLLENILSLYPSNPIKAKFHQRDIVNYIITHIALNCLSPQSEKVASLKDLQALCQQFPTDKKKCHPSVLSLLTLLFWPEDHDTDNEKEAKFEIIQSAVDHLKKWYQTKMKDIPQEKRRIYTHFFLGSGSGLDKFILRRKFECFSAEAFKMPEILKCVSGWTKDGQVYLEGPRKKKLNILPLYVPSVPHSNENITFYLGFTDRGPVAYNITVKK
ncbi:sterile alpha motif domain-containing protein 9-like isoform X2 [Sphaeramia orbicularis]|uniref:Sterile alpha motif domain-containing protein 9-like n=1 Tax=Sphaeramia orbicularis TaxID=375764 RepID=A0A673C8M9_9TELE|nr:sterile alpha motif domain-containing protein 9-like isoform X2 [Sphaeramia orbicularis]